MRYIKLFESLFSRDDTDKGLFSNPQGWLYTTARKDNYDSIKQYCNIDSEDITNVLTDFLDEYPEFNFQCAFYYDTGNLFTIYLYEKRPIEVNGFLFTYFLDIVKYPKIKELAEDVNSKFSNYGLQSEFSFSPEGAPGVTNVLTKRMTNKTGSPRCCKFVVTRLPFSPTEEEVPQKKKKWWNVFETLDYSKVDKYIEEIEEYLDNIKDDFRIFKLPNNAVNPYLNRHLSSSALHNHVIRMGANGFYSITDQGGYIYVMLGFNCVNDEVFEYIEEFTSRLSDSFLFEKLNFEHSEQVLKLLSPQKSENEEKSPIITLVYKVGIKK